MNKKRHIFIFLILFSFVLSASKIQNAFDALDIYDYFKAKKLFYQSLKKHPTEAAYGLAVIYYRQDNPFSKIDSAAKYIGQAISFYKQEKKTSQLLITSKQIDSLAFLISILGYEKKVKPQDIFFTKEYIKRFYFAPDSFIHQAVKIRDEFYFNQAATSHRSDSIFAFLFRFPESTLYHHAYNTYEYYVYKEQVKHFTESELKHFILSFKKNSYKPQAELKLFEIIKHSLQPENVYDYIKNYSSDITNEDAWKYLYSISVIKYSEIELQKFLSKYPEYPFKESIEKEIDLSNKILYPVQNADELWGYIDTSGHWAIPPIYDDVTLFTEGSAVVYRHDSCYYIDKENKRLFSRIFSEATGYKNGVALVKTNEHTLLINRSGQSIQEAFDEINEPSENLYIVKKNQLYGAINSKGQMVIPCVYKKLGDFKNGYAYYFSDKYGLIDASNHAYQDNWDWISNVDSNGIAIVKQNGLFGILVAPSDLILKPTFSFITPCTQNVFLVVKNGKYGFYDVLSKCFIQNPEFDYKPEFDAEYYSNGKIFKLIKDDDIAIIDLNGRVSIDYGKFEDVFFAKCDMIRILKKGKYGFVDRKLKTIIPPEFDEASDFHQDLAIVRKKDMSSILDKSGKNIFNCKNCKVSEFENQFLIQLSGKKGIVASNGQYLLQPVYDRIEKLNAKDWVLYKEKQMFLFKVSENTIKEID